jgi:hypothetical protein
MINERFMGFVLRPFERGHHRPRVGGAMTGQLEKVE